MDTLRHCSRCFHTRPPSASVCPHCGSPSIYPNVEKAEDESSNLDERYEECLEKAKQTGSLNNLTNFEKKIGGTKAIINRNLFELMRLCESEFNIYATYYELQSSKMHTGEIWDARRQVADSMFFTSYQEKIRFATLSLDSIGLLNYGECSWVLRDNMIAYRASVSEENTTMFILKRGINEASKIPLGYRATWKNRAKLCVAKLAHKISSSTKEEEFQRLLVKQGATSAEDEFVEVHIFGPITIKTIEQVSFKSIDEIEDKLLKETKRTLILAISEKLELHKVHITPWVQKNRRI